eukprot:5269823-Pleurochrysis_carterae.AAC.1
MHPTIEGGETCDTQIAEIGLKDEKGETNMALEELQGRREMEKYVHGMRNGELVGGRAAERRMRHTTRDGAKCSHWTYLKENGCRACSGDKQANKQKETIQHVMAGECDSMGRRQKM